MDFGNLINKGKEALAGEDGKIDYSGMQKDAQEAYKTFSTTEGSYTDKASAAYSEYQKDHASQKSSDETKSDSTEKN
ncbi:hypothetical protein METBIDRAFT_35846 [Metschnikowia bicuspidata var. bicuspidata NRRL YB-4993]|uniref:Uncharacterized protein n=1 Tax=Metschnikowia bicuspidata var. bicuspidata NRRL YB-4993 TaxID=869754 RepID=A0A1A0HFP5_9ASCO|nr:hypothetical protein METBIDRAFT_35846 [Metschnikowia bicuspidata var. bicuspidata NRRL YB-4993]OBA22678.1 hypothetical protein METBIDRAFT_35846 [Metschnikowia bicuspidata var. bicuspidata NRRL YB-4993]